MKRSVVTLVALCCLALAFTATADRRRAVGKPKPAPEVPRWFNDPLAGVTTAERAAFDRGRDTFADFQKLEDGLGPVFNGRGCSECHILPTIGGSGYFGTMTVGNTTMGPYDPLRQYGGPDIQGSALGEREKSTHRFSPDVKPAIADIAVHRPTPPLFGLGLVDATPDATFIALAEEQRARKPAIAGRVAMVDDLRAGTKRVGRFGVKANVPSLHQFVAMAERNELGMTNPDFPDENCPAGRCDELQFNPRPGINDAGDRVRQIVEFLSFLGAPPRDEVNADVLAGEKIFKRIECDSCHVATLETGDHPSAALNHVTYHPYSDFLLHDMGTMADGVVIGDARGKELRTAPLWGLRKKYALMNNSRTSSPKEAVLQHQGQGRASREQFQELSATERDQLIAFLLSL